MKLYIGIRDEDTRPVVRVFETGQRPRPLVEGAKFEWYTLHIARSMARAILEDATGSKEIRPDIVDTFTHDQMADLHYEGFALPEAAVLAWLDEHLGHSLLLSKAGR